MAVVPFRWQGQTRVEQIRALLAARSAEWLRTWSAPSGALECTLVQSDSDGLFERWVEILGSAGKIVVGLPTNVFEMIGTYLVGVVAPDSDGLAAGIGQRAFADLMQSISGASDPLLVKIDRPDPAGVTPRCGVAAFEWRLGSVCIGIFLDAVVCDALAPKQPIATERLTKRADAILHEQVTLKAVLDLGVSSLERTIDLRPGEVIKTETRLDALVRLQADTGDVAITGVLAAEAGQRALRCSNIERG
jgi:hypothetical protein